MATLEVAQLERMSFGELHVLVVSDDVTLWTLEKILAHVRECYAANEIAPDAFAPSEVRVALGRLSALEQAVLARLPEVAEKAGQFLDTETDRERLREIPTYRLIEAKWRALRHADENERLWPSVAALQLQAANEYDLELRRREDGPRAAIGAAIGTRQPASDVYSEGMRLVDVAKIHRAKMLAEVNNPDASLQRGNAAAFAAVEANVATRIECLKAFGFNEHARLLEEALHADDLAEFTKLEPGTLDPRD